MQTGTDQECTWETRSSLPDRESGAGTLEYTGVTVAITVIIASLVALPWASQFAPQVRDTISEVICNISSHLPGGGECGGDLLTEEDFQPRCTVSSNAQNAGSAVDIAWLSLGGDAGLSWQEFSDGEVHVTIMDGYSAGANA